MWGKRGDIFLFMQNTDSETLFYGTKFSNYQPPLIYIYIFVVFVSSLYLFSAFCL